METSLFLTLTLALTLGLVQGESVLSSHCPAVRPLSKVTEVRIIPCPLPGNGADHPCRLQRGNTSTISVDFVPEREITGLRASLSWVMTPGIELPFPGLEQNGCNSLTEGSCPLQPNTRYTWTATIKLADAYPLRTYNLKLKLTDGYPAQNVVLCETFAVQLVDTRRGSSSWW